MTFSEQIRQARLERGMDLVTLAGLSGLTTELIADAEAGRWVPGTDALFRLAVFLGLDPEALARVALEALGPED